MYILKGKATDSTYFHRIPSNLRSLVYSVGVKEGGAEEWNQAFKKYSTTHVASEKDILLDALTYTRNTQMIQKWVYRRVSHAGVYPTVGQALRSLWNEPAISARSIGSSYHHKPTGLQKTLRANCIFCTNYSKSLCCSQLRFSQSFAALIWQL